MIWIAAFIKAMMGLGLALPIEHKASSGSAPVFSGGAGGFYQIIFVV